MRAAGSHRRAPFSTTVTFVLSHLVPFDVCRYRHASIQLRAISPGWSVTSSAAFTHKAWLSVKAERPSRRSPRRSSGPFHDRGSRSLALILDDRGEHYRASRKRLGRFSRAACRTGHLIRMPYRVMTPFQFREATFQCHPNREHENPLQRNALGRRIRSHFHASPITRPARSYLCDKNELQKNSRRARRRADRSMPFKGICSPDFTRSTRPPAAVHPSKQTRLERRHLA